MFTHICPICKKLPNVELKHFLKYTCTVYCKTPGCKYNKLIIVRGFRKEKTMNRAADAWNNFIRKGII